MKAEMVTRGAVDIYKWNMFLATDVVGELSFGESFRTLEHGEKNQYVHLVESIGPLGAIRSAFPRLVSLASFIPFPMLNAVVNASKEARRYAQESLGRYYKLVSTDAGISHQTLFTKLHQSEKQREITFEEICANAQGYILAGSDTTASTLTYLIWSVCRQPDIKDKLLQQLRALPPRFEDNHLRKLPYLSHVVDETLRLYPAAPSGLPRETPIGGTVLGGYQLDAGTVVCAQSYSLHRNTRAFPNPEQFDPQRWTMPSTEMMDSFMPFGRGPRVCIGLHLARMELRAATANFFLSFPNARLSSREGFTDNSMRPKMFFVSNPVERRCLIEF